MFKKIYLGIFVILLSCQMSTKTMMSEVFRFVIESLKDAIIQSPGSFIAKEDQAPLFSNNTNPYAAMKNNFIYGKSSNDGLISSDNILSSIDLNYKIPVVKPLIKNVPVISETLSNSKQLINTRNFKDFLPVYLLTKGAGLAQEKINNINPLQQAKNFKDEVSNQVSSKMIDLSNKFGEGYKKTGEILSTNGQKILIAAIIMTIVYHSARPATKRLINGGFDLFEFGLKKSAKGFSSVGRFSGNQIITLMKYLRLLSPNFFKQVLNDDLILNNDVKEILGNYALLANVITESLNLGETHAKYQNIVLSGEDSFVKYEYSRNIALVANQDLLIIDNKSELFKRKLNKVQDLSSEYNTYRYEDNDEDKVKKYFDGLLEKRNASLILFDLSRIDLSKEFIKEKVRDILSYAKERSNKFSFVIVCNSIDNNLSELLNDCYDQLADIKKPNIESRNKIIETLIKEIIFDSKKQTTLDRFKHFARKLMFKKEPKRIWSSFNKVKPGFIDNSKIESFKKYINKERLDFVSNKLEGKSYSEVISFVVNLRALLGNKDLEAHDNYDSVVNILLNKSIKAS